MSANESVAYCLVRLEDLGDFLRGQMDGSPETRQYEQRLAHHINTVELAMSSLEILSDYREQVCRSLDKMSAALEKSAP